MLAGRIRAISSVGGPQNTSRTKIYLCLNSQPITLSTINTKLMTTLAKSPKNTEENVFLSLKYVDFLNFFKLEGRIGPSRGPHEARGPRV